MGKKNRKRNGKEKLKEKYRIEKKRKEQNGMEWNRIERELKGLFQTSLHLPSIYPI